MIGFALVLVLTTAALSLLAAFAVRVAGSALHRFGPHAERRAVELAAVLPVVLGIAVVGALLVRAYAGADHCQVHDHHAHLCLVHGAEWGARAWVVAVVAAAGAIVLARLGLLAFRHLRGRRALQQLRGTAMTVDGVEIVESPRAFCFVAGLGRPRVYASTAAWRGLAEDERSAVLAHERSHVAHRDLWRRFGIELLLTFAAPLVATPMIRRWAGATERLRDVDAAHTLGDAEPVARALVRLCRLDLIAATPSFQFAPERHELNDRVNALLTVAPTGHRAAVRLGWSLVVGAVAFAALAAVQVEPLHHALETLLG